MKVAMILPSLRNVGPVRVAHDIITELSGCNDIEFTVFYINEILELDFPCETNKLSIKNLFSLYQYDVIHSHMLKPDAINALLLFYKGHKITTIHNIVEADLYYSYGAIISRVFTKVWKFLWKRIDTCAVLSNVAQQYYEDLGICETKLKVLYNGVKETIAQKDFDSELSQKLESIKEQKRLLGTVCLFNHRKGLEQVIKALPEMANTVFVIIGDGPVKQELEELATNLAVEDKVIFLGFIHNPLSYLHLFDVYMMPSREEGFSLALLDAVVNEIPVCCSSIPIFKEAFADDEVSFFDLDDTTGLVNSVDKLCGNRDLFVKKAKKRFLENYTREKMAENYKCLYQNQQSKL